MTQLKNGAATETILSEVQQAIERTQQYLLGRQHPDGFWKGELEADASVSAGYIPLMHFMGMKPPEGRFDKIIRTLKRSQNADGSWSAYYKGPGDISVTAQVYFAIKLAGVSADEPFMQRARTFMVDNGGLIKVNLITRIWLALFGEFKWEGIPTIPPELVLLPCWFYFNIYECSSWARATIMAMAVLTTEQPVCPVPEHAHIEELYAEPESERDYTTENPNGLVSWESLFLTADRAFKVYQKLPVKPLRKLALQKTTEWILERQEEDGSWGGIMLPWIYSLFALKCLGYNTENAVIKKGMAGIEDFIIETEDSFLMEPAVSPVWDTVWAASALQESGLKSDHPSLANAAEWLMSKEIRVKGDWIVKNPDTQPGCWAFEFENRNYPDIDDTSVVPRVLNTLNLPSPEREKARKEAIQRGVDWVISMQGDNGGWAAFDLNNNKNMLNHIPFSDFMTPLDPVSPDVTNHAIELLSQFGDRYREQIDKGITYLKRSQEADGAWFGRWGVNYLYGTGLVLPSLKAAGEDMDQRYIKEAVTWLKNCQNSDGGWGESCLTYENPAFRGRGESTFSQTAWALLGLLAAGEELSDEVHNGITYLINNQNEDGSWTEHAFTGTGFPRAFYLRYEYYKINFPLMALARYHAALKEVSNG